jgi:hypothetical protein
MTAEVPERTSELAAARVGLLADRGCPVRNSASGFSKRPDCVPRERVKLVERSLRSCLFMARIEG